MGEITLRTKEEIPMRKFGQLRLTVTDSGAGMSAEQLSELFGEGVQFNANKLQKGGGSGLGLYISKGIVESHNGTLSASSEGLGKGTTFELYLPLYDAQDSDICGLPDSAEDTEELKIAFNSRSASVLRILIVDDVGSNRKFLRRLLEMKGHICEDAENGQIALEKIKQAEKPYDSVLMDYEMPVMDGPTATRTIRSLGYDVFVVGVTGNMLAEDVDYYRSCGANDVIGKPVKLDVLEDLWIEYGLLSGEAVRDEL